VVKCETKKNISHIFKAVLISHVTIQRGPNLCDGNTTRH